MATFTKQTRNIVSWAKQSISSGGGLWSSGTLPWQLTLPWQTAAPGATAWTKTIKN